MKKFILTAIFLSMLLSGFAGARISASENFSEKVATDFIRRYPCADSIHWPGEPNHFSWQAGYIMFAMEHLWRQTNDSAYFRYIRQYVDDQVMPDGSVPDFNPVALDNFIPGYACLFMYEQTGDERYAKAAETIRRGFDNYPRTELGMFTHSYSIPQVWVDGVFMGQMFMARYARTLDHPEDFNEVARQLKGVFRLCGKKNGLLYHGWAPRGKEWWTPSEQGHSPEVWSEGMGWVAVLLADVFDYLPDNFADREELVGYLRAMCRGLKDSQDAATGLWCQVVDKPGHPGNWNETSGSAMFTYLLQRAMDKGFIGEEYRPVVLKAYDGLKTRVRRNDMGFLDLIDCSSIGIQKDYDAYVGQPREVSPFASFGSYILGTGIVEHDVRNVLGHEFWATDYSQNKVLHFLDGRIAESFDAPVTNDLWVLDNGNILFGAGRKVVELTPAGDTVFLYNSKSNIFACQRLENGNTFVGECNGAALLEIDPQGNIVKKTNIMPKGSKDAGDAFMRNARRLKNGNYLVAHYGPQRVTEYDSKGRVVRNISVPGGPHSVIRLDNGNTLVAVADKDNNPRIVEYAPDGSIDWQLTNDDLAGKPLRFMSGMQLLNDGSLLITNWQGHLPVTEQPHLLWVTRDKKIRALLPPVPGIVTLSSVFLHETGVSRH